MGGGLQECPHPGDMSPTALGVGRRAVLSGVCVPRLVGCMWPQG